MLDPNQLRALDAFKYGFTYGAGEDRLVFAAWLLSQPSAKPWEAIRNTFSRHDGVDPVAGTRWRAWLIPTSAGGAPAHLLHVAAAIDTVLVGSPDAVNVLDKGYYSLVQLDDNSRDALILLDDGSWGGPIVVPFPEVSPERAQIEGSVIPFEVEMDSFDLEPSRWSHLSSPSSVPVIAIVDVSSYGPHPGFIGINKSFESTYEGAEEFKRNNKYFEEERNDIWETARRDHPGDEDAQWDYFNQVLTESLQAIQVTMPVWEAASYATEVNVGDDGLSEIEPIDLMGAVGGTRVWFQDDTWWVQSAADRGGQSWQPAIELAEGPPVPYGDNGDWVPNWIRALLADQAVPVPVYYPLRYQIAWSTEQASGVFPEMYFDEDLASTVADQWLALQGGDCENCRADVIRYGDTP